VKPFLLVLVLISLCISSTFAQKTVPSKKKNVGASTHAFQGTDGDTCLFKQFSLVFYLPNDSGLKRTPSTPARFIDSLVLCLNKTFGRICVGFTACSTVVIPHYTLNDWVFGQSDQVVVKSWHTDKVINVYLPDLLDVPPGYERMAYACNNGVFGAVQNTFDMVVVQTSASFTVPPVSTPGGFFSSALHAFGHFFGLPDTHATLGPPASPPPPSTQIGSHEFADGSNSAVNGDLFADTEADPFPYEWWPNGNSARPTHCTYGLVARDGKGHDYQPPLDNIMSLWDCRCRFTQEQYNFMARYIVKNRLYLH
jgi:hypothetical protein